MQVQVDHVKAHIPRPDHAHDRIQIGAVIVAQAAGLMDQPGDFPDIPVKFPHRIGIGQHQTRCIRTQGSPQRIQIYAPVRGRRDIYYDEPVHIGRSRIGAVGGIRYDDLFPCYISPRFMVGLDQRDAGKFPMSAGCGLEGHIDPYR